MADVQFYVTKNKDENSLIITDDMLYTLPEGHNFTSEDDVEPCIEDCAKYYHNDCDGWEDEFPLNFMLWIDKEYIGMFNVDREFEPVFSASEVTNG